MSKNTVMSLLNTKRGHTSFYVELVPLNSSLHADPKRNTIPCTDRKGPCVLMRQNKILRIKIVSICVVTCWNSVTCVVTC